MNGEALVGFLQFSDGLFPAGSYAHSFGLEACVAEGRIRTAEGVENFLSAYLQGSVGPTDVIAAVSSCRAALSHPKEAFEPCASIDHKLEAMKPSSELRGASRQMGRQVLRVATALGEPFNLGGLTVNLFRAVEKNEIPGHHAMAFGVVAAALKWPEPMIAHAYLYSTCSGLVAAALRLIPLGQLAGQQILWHLAPTIDSLAKQSLDKDMSDAWSFAPGIEIASMRHATLDARLFRS